VTRDGDLAPRRTLPYLPPVLSRRDLVATLSALAAALVLGAPGEALAKPKKPRVIWSSIRVREGRDQPLREAALAKILEKESRRVDWGKGRTEPVDASIDVRELDTVVDGDVARVTCAAVGRLRGAGAAKSKFSYGGRPQDRAKLEQHVLELVARGIVTRLAEMARATQPGWSVGRS
jgi:hypothetical protein